MTIADPFAPAPYNPEPDLKTEHTGTAPAVVNSAATSEGKVVVTLKGGSGYDAPWIVIHAANVDEAYDTFDDKLAELMTKVQAAGAHFSGQAPAKPAATLNAGGRPLQPGQPAGSVQPPSWALPMPDGYLYKTGTKNGSTWHAYWPVDSRSGLEKIWLKQPK